MCLSEEMEGGFSGGGGGVCEIYEVLYACFMRYIVADEDGFGSVV